LLLSSSHESKREAEIRFQDRGLFVEREREIREWTERQRDEEREGEGEGGREGGRE